MDTMRKVDFFCVGAAKAGTTWLADSFRDHPDVYVPLEKEVGYFNASMIEDPSLPNLNHNKLLSWYHDFYRSANEGQLLGDLTPGYMRYEGTAERIHAYNPLAKIIIMLRDPLERSHSEFLFWQQRGVVNYKSFEEAIAKYPHILNGSLYCAQVRPFLETFGDENIHLVLFDELKVNAKGVYDEVARFLGIRPIVSGSVFRKVNTTQTPIFRPLNAMISGMRLTLRRHEPLRFLLPFLRGVGVVRVAEAILSLNKTGKRPSSEVDIALSEELKNFFQEDIQCLEKLTGLNLTHWK
jgi:hypothetical protein